MSVDDVIVVPESWSHDARKVVAAVNRKSKGQPREAGGDAQDKGFVLFKRASQAVHTLDEARALIRQAPPRESPERAFYTALDSFLSSSFTVPGSSSREELFVYLALIQRLTDISENDRNRAQAALLPLLRD